MNAIIGTAQYEHLQLHKPLTHARPLVWNYFSAVHGDDGNILYYAACNGWIYGGDPTLDFASSSTRAYLRRDIVIWGDNVKLRYHRPR